MTAGMAILTAIQRGHISGGGRSSTLKEAHALVRRVSPETELNFMTISPWLGMPAVRIMSDNAELQYGVITVEPF